MKPNFTSRHKQQGIAMITAMMIVAICVTVVASIFVQQRYSIRLASNFQDLEQTYQYAYAAEDLAGVLLKRDFTENKHDSAFDIWASKEIKPFEIDDDEGNQIGLMQIEIEDMQGRFNVNNLVKKAISQQASQPSQTETQAANSAEVKPDEPRPAVLTAFQVLLQQSGLPADFSDSVVDWIDENDEPFNNGAESDYYQALPKPYSAANTFLTDSHELAQLKLEDLTDSKEKAEKLESLMLHVTALPTPTAINVNTATQEVLLATGMLPRDADMIINLRQSQPLADMGVITGGGLSLNAKSKSLLGFASNYFRLSGEVKLGKSRLFLNSLLFRSPEGDVRVIMRQFSRVPKPKTEKPAFSG